MRLSLRFLLPLALVLAGLAYAVIPLVDTLTLKWFVRDLESRSELIGRMVRSSPRRSPGVGFQGQAAQLFLSNPSGRTALRHRVLRPGRQAGLQDLDLP